MDKFDSELVEIIVKRVLKTLNTEKRKKVLAIFCGGKIGAEEGLAGVSQLVSAGCDLQAVFTESGEQILGVDWLQAKLGNIPAFTSKNGKTVGEILEKTDMMVIPVLTLNSAAKVAHGIADNMVTNLIMKSLFNGIPIIAAKDACDIANPIREKMNPSFKNQVYKNIFHDNLKVLEKIGIKMTTAHDIGEVALSVINEKGSFSTGLTKGKNNSEKSAELTDCLYKGRILSTGEIERWTGPILRVGAGTLITPAAKDMASERGIEVLYD
jgi:hypothetical protein